MAGLFQRIRAMLSRPKAPKIQAQTAGHRGIAARSIAKPNLTDYAERLAAGKTTISQGEVDDFLHAEQPLFVHSSNVVMFQYFEDVEKMMVEFKGGASYLYSDVPVSEALAMANAQSKGAAIWDHFRVRGSRTAHKRAYVRIK